MQINLEPTTQESFFFEPIQNGLLDEKETKEILTKWGLLESLKIGSFRFNQNFVQYDINRFLLDLFNNPNVRYISSNLGLSPKDVSQIETTKLRCHQLTMELFDKLEQDGLVKNGYISKMAPDYFEDIEICDKIRQCLVIQESQSYCTFNEDERKQFIFKLFQLLVLGGSFNQYQDIINPYLQWTKKVYKNLVSVRKRPQTEGVFVETSVFEINTIDKGKAFKKGDHPQNILYVIINPSIRSVHIMANNWKKHW